MFSFLRTPTAADPAGLAFTDRHGGVTPGAMGALNLGRTDVDDPAHITENYARLARELGVRELVTVSQVHGRDVVVVDETLLASGETGPGRQREADALITDQRGVGIVIRVADCVPVLFTEATGRWVGAAHAGRVGLAAGVLTATVATLRERGAGQISAWVGPHICGGCYEVPETMRTEIAAGLPAAYATTTWGTPALDLGAAAAAQLSDLGCTVTRVDPCTRESQDLFSHRRDGAEAGRLGAIAWLA